MTTSSVGDELREESGFEFVHDEGAFIPFSHGPANCVGTEALAMRQMRVVVTVCALVQRFRVALNPGEEEGDGDGGRHTHQEPASAEAALLRMTRRLTARPIDNGTGEEYITSLGGGTPVLAHTFSWSSG
ncbi:hypothetical protein GSI_09598 [Ganoderma sinense ZZ0214-1]|uniref:Cytochrome P450 n=1 Tax=Ganoderma sinense ZZ0214-1 TaxID=1077348 RepID=A0A2G8S3G2_9APHY|nr:hypothetical protein GSI_09598 [Ganoderma sinense ZZ0214-1]